MSEETGYDRKHIIKLLNSKKRKIAQKRGAPIKLTGEDIDLVRRIWALSHYTNAEYLQQNIHRWLTDYSLTQEEPLSKNQIKRISSVSYKTLERALKAFNFTHISQLLQKSLNVIFEKVRYDNPLDDELPF